LNCWLFGKSRGKQELELGEYGQDPCGYVSIYSNMA
jgi:hypothetical protein